MRNVLPTSASDAGAHPWTGLEQALLVRGATSVVISERGDVLSVRFAIDDRLVRLEVSRAEPIGGYTGWVPARPVTQWSVTKGTPAAGPDGAPAGESAGESTVQSGESA